MALVSSTVTNDGDQSLLAIVLAAGEGTRMKSDTAKVLHRVLGIPMLGHVLGVLASLSTPACSTYVLVGHRREAIQDYVTEDWPRARTAIQHERNGTGHAVLCALAAADADGQLAGAGSVLVVAGDVPLLRAATLDELFATHESSRAAVTVLTANVGDPAGYGRVIRDSAGSVTGIVEHADASGQQQAIAEINSAIYVFRTGFLRQALTRIDARNSQGELYLTDVIGIARSDGEVIAAQVVADPEEVHGVNDRVQLAAASSILQRRVNRKLMTSGVTLVDPATAWIEPGAIIGRDTVIERNCHIDARTVVGERAVIGPDTTLLGCEIGDAAHVLRSHCAGARLHDHAQAGPFTYLRPGTELHAGSRAGAFVEVKNARIGRESKVPHLSYVGDAEIGDGTNIGAATVFVNYDGVAKHRTIVGDHARVGSDTMLVAPVTVGDGAYTAAGSVITEDVEPGALAIGRARQTNVADWVRRNRPGTASATAAQAATAGPGPDTE